MIAFFRNLVVREFWLKLFSLALAILIWKIVSPHVPGKETANLPGKSTELTGTYFNVSLGVVSSAGDVHDFKVSPSSIEVTVRAEPEIFKKLQATDIHAQVDLTGIEAAQDLRKRIEVVTPPGVAVVRCEPDQADVIVPPKKESAQSETQ